MTNQAGKLQVTVSASLKTTNGVGVTIDDHPVTEMHHRVARLEPKRDWRGVFDDAKESDEGPTFQAFIIHRGNDWG